MSPRNAAGRVTVGLLMLAACTRSDAGERLSSEAGGNIRVVDATGSEVVIPAPARRIVSLVPSATETLHAMGRGDVLVGRTDYDVQPWALRLPSVGGGLEPNLEEIVALAPDLVIRFAGEQDVRTPERLAELGVPQLAVRPDRIEDIYLTAQLLGDAIGARAAADSLVASVRSGLEEVAALAGSLPPKRFVFVLGGTPPWVAGPGTYIDQVVSLLGGENVFGDLSTLYAAVSPEQLRTRRPEVVLVSDPSAFDASLTPGARVVGIGEALGIPGPGLVDAAYLVAEKLHGRKLR